MPESCEIKLYWQLTEEELAEVYKIAEAEKLLDLVAFDAAINKQMFLLFAGQVEVFGLVLHLTDNAPKGKPVGFFYLTAFEGATARLHFCAFKAGRDHRHRLGKIALDWCFATFEFQSLVGVIPAYNLGARQYALEMGGEFRGLIPGACWIKRLKRAVAGAQFLFLPSKKTAAKAA